MKGSDYKGVKAAGLQVKVSTRGMGYIFRDVLNSSYEVPLVYFDLKGDYGHIYKKVQGELNKQGDTSRNLKEWFISAREIDPDGFEEVEYYLDMVNALVKGTLRPVDLINRAEKIPSFGSAIMAAGLDSIPSNVFLGYSKDFDNKPPEVIL